MNHKGNIRQGMPESPVDPCRSDGQKSNEVSALHMWESNSKTTYTNSGVNESTNGDRVWSSVKQSYRILNKYTKLWLYRPEGVPMDKRCMLGRPTVRLSSSWDRGHPQINIYKLLASKRDSASFTWIQEPTKWTSE